MSNRDRRFANLKVKSGQIVGLRPFLSRYQLTQPPVFHTVGVSLRCTISLYDA